MADFRRAAQYIRQYGWRDTAERVAARLGCAAFHSASHKRATPTLSHLYDASLRTYVSASELLVGHVLPDGNAPSAAELLEEFRELVDELEQRYARRRLDRPRRWGLEEGSSFLIYAIVRVLRPAVILETGVANGHSTFFLLRSLARNGSGTLHSTDVTGDVGALLEDSEKANWRLHVLPERDCKGSFVSAIDALPGIDLLLQDSDHWYGWATFELRTVFRRMKPRSCIVADDVDASYAFLDFCAVNQLRPIFLVEKRKVLGLVMVQ